jgi:hypothetical protein
MTDNKKAAGVSKPQATLTSIYSCYFSPIPNRLKVAVYRLAPWLFFLGMLHG